MNGTTDRPITRLYLDTNILIALAEGDDEVSDLLWKLLSLNADEPICCTSEFTLAELAVLPIRQKNEELLQLYRDWFSSQALFNVVRLDQIVLLRAARIRAETSSIRMPDAIHLASAAAGRCRHILSADQRLPAELTIGASDADEPEEATLFALRPDRATLDELFRKVARS